MTQHDLNFAIAHLRTLDATAAAADARACAAELVPKSAEYRTPADLAALSITALALYRIAKSDLRQHPCVVRALAAILHKHHDEVRNGRSPEDLFADGISEPEPIGNYMRATAQLPPVLIETGIAIAINSIAQFSAQGESDDLVA